MRQITLFINSQLESALLIRKCLQGLCRLTPFSSAVVDDMQLCVSEGINNVIEHGYQNRPDCELSIKVMVQSDRMEIEIQDTGIAMPGNWLEIATNKVIDFDPEDIENIPTGGWGLFIIKSKMDDVKYVSDNQLNTLTLIKHFD